MRYRTLGPSTFLAGAMLLLCAWLWPLLAAARRPAEPPPTRSDMTLDAATRRAVLDSAIKTLKALYVFPDTAAKMEAALREHERRGDYDRMTLGPAFAERLTLELRELSQDRHLYVGYSVAPLPEEHDPKPSPRNDDEEYRRTAERQNFGFERVERLPGNIGYLDLRGFYRTQVAAEAAFAAMALVADTGALIIDLRNNGGGNPTMIALLAAYFLEGERVHLSDVVWRSEDRVEPLFAWPYVPGKRYTTRPVYLLTSRDTFSAGEAFAYILKSHQRATLIGETTGGGANAGRGHRIGAHFQMIVPAGRVVSPVTHSNWEGTGVQPDVQIPASIALETAHRDALTRLAASERDPAWARQLADLASNAQKRLDEARAKLPPEVAPSLAGNTVFRLPGASFARRVALAGSFNSWDPTRTPCARQGTSDWVCRIDLGPGRYTYQFVVDGLRLHDPANPSLQVDEEGKVSSVLTK